MITFKPDELINRNYLTEPDEQGRQFRAEIVQKIIDNETSLQERPVTSSFWFLLKMARQTK
jgi:hypothetical protein